MTHGLTPILCLGQMDPFSHLKMGPFWLEHNIRVNFICSAIEICEAHCHCSLAKTEDHIKFGDISQFTCPSTSWLVLFTIYSTGNVTIDLRSIGASYSGTMQTLTVLWRASFSPLFVETECIFGEYFIHLWTWKRLDTFCCLSYFSCCLTVCWKSSGLLWMRRLSLCFLLMLNIRFPLFLSSVPGADAPVCSHGLLLCLCCSNGTPAPWTW